MKRILIISLVLGLTACASSGQEKIEKLATDELYTQAKTEFTKGNFSNAIKLYDELQAKFPYGDRAVQAQLDVAYAHYKQNEMSITIAACDEFISLHPSHPATDYAYYLKGLAQFREDAGILALIGQQDSTEREPKAAQDAFNTFNTLVKKYPSSQYAEDAKQRMAYLSHVLAAHELHVARYYKERRSYLAAANRGKYVLENFPLSPLREEALSIMIQSYQELGLNDLSADASRILKLNYPHSVFLPESERMVENSEDPFKTKKVWWKFWQ
jgi:outer membrane protein assembly factor BamD